MFKGRETSPFLIFKKNDNDIQEHKGNNNAIPQAY